MSFDPESIPLDQYPLIVFADNNYGIVQSLIKGRTKGDYSHVMFLLAPGTLVSQGFVTYARVPLTKYLKPGNRLKFVAIEGMTVEGRTALKESINAKLRLPWWKKGYDWLGIVGQATGLTFLQNPWQDYCSEDVPQHLKRSALKFPNGLSAMLQAAIKNIPARVSPQQLNAYMKDFKDLFKVIGKWEFDD